MQQIDETLRATVEALVARADASELPRVAAEGSFTREQIVASIRRWTKRYGQPPREIDWDPAAARRRGKPHLAQRFEESRWPSLAMVRRQFGTLGAARRVAGVAPPQAASRARPHALTDEEILAAIRSWTERHGEPPSMSDWAPARARRCGQHWRAQRYLAGDWPSLSTVLRRFGTLSAAVTAAGVPPRPRGRHTLGRASLTVEITAAVVTELEARRLACSPMTLAARTRAVADANSAGDAEALRGALIDVAAAALSWADAIAVPAVSLGRLC